MLKQALTMVCLVLLSACSASHSAKTLPSARATPTADSSVTSAAAREQLAESNLKIAIGAAHVYWTDNHRSYSGFDPATGERIADQISWRGDIKATANKVSINLADGSDIVLSTSWAPDESLCIAETGKGVSFGRVDGEGFQQGAKCRGGW